MPTVTKLSPAAGPAAGGTRVVVTGEGFNLSSRVTIGGDPVIGQVISDTEIQFTTPARVPGPAQVIVTAATVESDATAASVFSFLPPPIIERLEASDWHDPKARVTLGGANLVGVTSVTFNGRPSVGFTVDHDGTTITATRPPGAAGSTAIVVTTAGGTSVPCQVWFLPDQTQLAIFVTQLVYIGLLIGGLIAYVTWTGFRNGLPNPLAGVPLGVPWSGAMGAVTLSLSGLVYHRDNWDRSFIFWHLSRPLIGAIVGTFAYLVIAAGVLASGGQPTGSTNAAGQLTATPGFGVTNLFYYVLAFAVGYREEKFRALLQKVFDVVFGPGQSDGSANGSSPASTGTTPTTASSATTPTSHP